MVVQHNILAMNSNRQFGITTGIQAKSSEKLSSGYRINRAADDSAGREFKERTRGIDENEDYAITFKLENIDGFGGDNGRNILGLMESESLDTASGAELLYPGTLVMRIDSTDFPSAILDDNARENLESAVLHETMHAVMDVLLPEGMDRSDTQDDD